MIPEYLFGFFLALVIATAITPIVVSLMRRYQILDDPSSHKHPAILHTKPIPRGGGIALFLGVALAALFLIPFSEKLFAILFASLLALFVGIYDDIQNAKGKDLSPYVRFVTNIISAIIIVSSGISIAFITNPFGGILRLDTIVLVQLPFIAITLAQVLTILWIVWIMNMLNWSKGVDGQMPGIVAISAIIIGLLSLRTGNGQEGLLDAMLSFMIAGSAIGFLFYNFPPAKIFPGYGGTAIYLLLAVVSVLSSAKLATALLVMGVPAVDAIITVGRRILSGYSPFRHDRKHLHHLLLKRGWNSRSIALSYWLISAILGALSLTLESRSKLFALSMLIAVVGGFLLFLHLSTEEGDEKNSP